MTDAAEKPKGSIKEAAKAMNDNKKLPPDSKMEKVVQKAKTTGYAKHSAKPFGRDVPGVISAHSEPAPRWRLRPVTFLPASNPSGSSAEPLFEPPWRSGY
jgi:uncharacterized protein YjbJ (UPF0337 family)